ncbi:alpha/beta hydrolase [Variovorax sp. ZT5P49]|uniref:alpha/beta hydrolase n=1 Tax=Variovorax sp. ZT5P49 TaxID=3443733 RepID=UPI003F474A5D
MNDDFSVTSGAQALRGTITNNPTGDAPCVLALHGGGQSSRRGIQYLLAGLARGGVASASFDFSGHGESSGQLEGSSLNERVAQAIAVAGHVAPGRPFSLIGTSMGGHIACSLIERLQPPALVLFCPAAYVAQAQDAPFGPQFQGILRSTVDYASSPAFTALEGFEGRLLLVYGTADAVIPAQVLEQYERRARRVKSVEVIRLAGAGHKLHDWLQAHPQDHDRVLDAALRTLSG